MTSAGSSIINLWEKVYFLAVGLLALWVGFWGYFVPLRVDKAIPFLVPPLHARFLGAMYLSGLTLMIGGIVARRWGDIRVLPVMTATWTGGRAGVIAILFFAVGVLVASAIHRDLFSADDPEDVMWFLLLVVISVSLGLLSALSIGKSLRSSGRPT
ncbi:hypothetical protein BH24ACT26_BH24ACT26_18390 [soil metagenome]